jgi:hypothetical protein
MVLNCVCGVHPCVYFGYKLARARVCVCVFCVCVLCVCFVCVFVCLCVCLCGGDVLLLREFFDEVKLLGCLQDVCPCVVAEALCRG